MKVQGFAHYILDPSVIHIYPLNATRNDDKPQIKLMCSLVGYHCQSLEEAEAAESQDGVVQVVAFEESCSNLVRELSLFCHPLA